MKAFEKRASRRCLLSSLHNILKFFFIATQSVSLSRNDQFMIILGFGLKPTDTARKTVQLEISWENIKRVINHICVFLGQQFFESRGGLFK